MCISAVALPVGFHLASHLPIKPLLAQATPTMTHPPPPVSEIVSCADELYDSNKMREGLTYLKQYEHLDEVEVNFDPDSQDTYSSNATPEIRTPH